MHRHRTARSLTALTGLLILASCGTEAREGDCGSELSSGECYIVRTQLGPLPKDIPVDPTNSFTSNESARKLGQALFFDTCLSEKNRMSCATCHQGGAALADGSARPLLVRVVQTGSNKAQNLPPLEELTTEAASDPGSHPLKDAQGQPLAVWNSVDKRWVGISRRTQTSPSANADDTYTGRNTPTLYNMAYGSGVQPADHDRSYGVVWTPLDGRYDSLWALSGEVFEFRAVQRTNRTYLAHRIFRAPELRKLYDSAFPDMKMQNLSRMTEGPNAKRIYPLNASPTTAAFQPDWVACWNNGVCAESDLLVPLDPEVKPTINQILANAGKAVGSYIHNLRSNQSRYDKFVGYWTKVKGSNVDTFVAADRSALSPAQQRGLRLFLGKAQCIQCHSGPNFTDWRFHNLGVPTDDVERRANGSMVPLTTGASLPIQLPAQCPPGTGPSPECPDQGRFAWQNRLAGSCPPSVDAAALRCQNTSTLSCRGAYNKPESDAMGCLPKEQFDSCALDANVPMDMASQQSACSARPGCAYLTEYAPALMKPVSRCVPRSTDRDLGAFKTPSLRNVGKTWPYMHNGAIFDHSVDTQEQAGATPHLRKVVEFYNQGGGTPVIGVRDPVLRPLLLTRTEIDDLVEFLQSLTDDTLGSRDEDKPLPLPDVACPT